MVNIIWHKVTSPPHTDVFARWRQCASHLVHPIGIHTVLVLPPADSLWVYWLLDIRACPGLATFPVKIASVWIWAPSNTWPTQIRIPNVNLIVSAVFAQLMAESPILILYNELPISPQIAPLHGWSGPSCNTWFLWSTQVHIQNGTLVGSSFFAGFAIVTDWQTKQLTGHATPSVTVGRIYVVLRCSLMKNNIPVNCQACYGDGAGNTVEENSSVFSLILMR